MNTAIITVLKSKSVQKVLKEGTEEFDGVKITAIPYFHDNAQGAKRGKISLFRIEAEDMVLAFLSDLGTLLTEKELEALASLMSYFYP